MTVGIAPRWGLLIAYELNINVTTLKDWISRDRGLQPRLKRLILQLSLNDHRRNMPVFGYNSAVWMLQ